MTAEVVAVKPDDSLASVVKLSRQHKIRHLPVVEHGALVGIVTDRDLRAASTHPALFDRLLDLLASLDRGLVKEIMAREVVTATPDMSVAKAAKLMREHNVGCLPVVKDNTVVGIVTASDLLGVLAAL